ncbi:MAG: prolyl oligopeptidase family serine peptidase [Alistipes sp.]
MNRTLFTVATAGLAAFTFMSCDNTLKIKHMPYPDAPRSEVVDDYFGTQVPDPYRWLEDDNSAETAAWVTAENAVTQNYLEQIPFRNAIKERLTELWDYPKESAPAKHGDYNYYYYNDGLQNQSILYRVPVAGGDPTVFLDPNKLSEDGTVALVSTAFSKDDRLMAYAASASGSDWVEIRVMDVATGQLTADKINWVKNSGASWAPDSKGFYYSAYDAPTKNVFSAQNQFQKIYYHKLGDAQSADRLIFEDPTHPLRYFQAWEKGGWLFIMVSDGTSGAEILYRRATEAKAPFQVLLKGFDYDYSLFECKDNYLYYTTNKEAANHAVRKVNLLNTSENTVVIPETKNLLEGVSSVGGTLIITYLEKAQSKAYQYDFNGQLLHEIVLPAIGTIGGFDGKEEDTETYYSFSNFTTPPTSYHYDLKTGESTLYKTPKVNFDPELFVTDQVFYPSKDGTEISMFIVHRKDMKLNGKNTCYLYGYGGFQINLTPGFNPSAILFVEQGGVYCYTNLRGGSEYGESWHKGGMLDAKQNVFDDFIGAAEWLIANKYTSSEKLAIAGGSNGGLLVGACEVQRPDLFAVCLPAVGVMDMLRYHKFTIGWGWAVEYGTSDNEEQFKYIYKYSPLHNIKEGAKYPATLITTADHDDRVVPAHSFKFAAQMQHCQAGEAPILIRIDSKAGHGAGKPTTKRIEEAADTYSFLFANTNTTYKPIK